MNQGKASKRQACELIRTAVKDGWKREVSTLSIGDRPFNVMVSLSRVLYYSNSCYINMSQYIVVSFRRTFRGRWVVSIAQSRTNDENAKTYRGLWGANYATTEMREAASRQAEHDEARKVLSA